MATVATNVLINGLSGKFGSTLLFKTLRGKTIVSAVPRKPDKKKESEAQRTTRSTFQKATRWAQTILLDPETKAYYQQRARVLKLPNAYTAAITDYMRKAKVMKYREKNSATYVVSKPGFALKEVRATADKPGSVISITRNRDAWQVMVTWVEGVAPPVILHITDLIRRERQVEDIPI